jgi:hypothetical protein
MDSYDVEEEQAEKDDLARVVAELTTTASFAQERRFVHGVWS